MHCFDNTIYCDRDKIGAGSVELVTISVLKVGSYSRTTVKPLEGFFFTLSEADIIDNSMNK